MPGNALQAVPPPPTYHNLLSLPATTTSLPSSRLPFSLCSFGWGSGKPQAPPAIYFKWREEEEGQGGEEKREKTGLAAGGCGLLLPAVSPSDSGQSL